MEDENQSSLPLYSGSVWQKQSEIYTVLLQTAAGGQQSWRRTLLETHTTKNLYPSRGGVPGLKGTKHSPAYVF